MGSIIGWARPWVRPSSPKSMTTWGSLRRSAPRASSGDSGMLDRIAAERLAGDEHRLVGERAAAEQARAARRAPGPRASRPGQLGHCGAGAPSADSAASMAAVRSGRPGPRVAQWTGLPSVAAYACTSASTSGAGGLDTTTIEVVAGSAARAASACRVERPRTAGGQVAPADAEAVAHAHPGGVEQAHDLLGAGARGGDEPDRAGARGVGEAERDPADDRGAAVGAHEQHVGLGGRVLERDLVLDADVVGEEHHRQPRVDRVEGLDDGVARRAPR